MKRSVAAAGIFMLSSPQARIAQANHLKERKVQPAEREAARARDDQEQNELRAAQAAEVLAGGLGVQPKRRPKPPPSEPIGRQSLALGLRTVKPPPTPPPSKPDGRRSVELGLREQPSFTPASPSVSNPYALETDADASPPRASSSPALRMAQAKLLKESREQAVAVAAAIVPSKAEALRAEIKAVECREDERERQLGAAAGDLAVAQINAAAADVAATQEGKLGRFGMETVTEETAEGKEEAADSAMSELEAAVYASIGHIHASSLETQRRFVSRSCASDLVSLLIADTSPSATDEGAVERLVSRFRDHLNAALQAELASRMDLARSAGAGGGDFDIVSSRFDEANGTEAGGSNGAGASSTAGRSVASLSSALFANMSLSDMLTTLEEFGDEEAVFDRSAFRRGMCALVDESAVAQVALLSDELYDVFDVDNDGQVDWEELSAGVSMLSQSDSESKARAIFELYDFDSVGFISEDELTRFLEAFFALTAKMSESVSPVSADERKALASGTAAALFGEVDTDGTGAIALPQFRQCLDKLAACDPDELRAFSASPPSIHRRLSSGGGASAQSSLHFDLNSIVGMMPEQVRGVAASLVQSPQTLCVFASGLALGSSTRAASALSDTRRLRALIGRMRPLLAGVEVLLVMAMDEAQSAQIAKRAKRIVNRRTGGGTPTKTMTNEEREMERRKAAAEGGVCRLVVFKTCSTATTAAQLTRRLSHAFCSRAAIERSFPSVTWQAL